MVSSLWPPVVLGGAELYAAALAQHLREGGDEVGALTLGVDGDDVVAEVRAWPYRLDRFETQSSTRRAVFHALDVYRPDFGSVLDRAVERFAPDVVHSHSIAGLSTAALTTPARRGIPHVHTLHDYWLLCRRSSLVHRNGTNCDTRCRSCVALSRTRAALVSRHPPDVLLAVSTAVARAHEQLGWAQGRLRVVRNPVEVRIPDRRDRPPGAPVTFGFLGRLTREKGAATLVRAFTESGLGAGEHARLVLAGDGPLFAELERAVPEGVELLGWVTGSAKEDFFAALDCLVVPSEWPDPAPLVVDEARSRRLPVIGARAGGIPELVAPSGASLLFESGDPVALADRLQDFAAAPRSFADDGAGIVTWDEHLALVRAAYVDAAAA